MAERIGSPLNERDDGWRVNHIDWDKIGAQENHTQKIIQRLAFFRHPVTWSVNPTRLILFTFSGHKQYTTITYQYHRSTSTFPDDMAALYPIDTPDRLLKRVQQLEDMELPSLPSFQHDDDIDYDSESGTGSDNSGPLNITKVSLRIVNDIMTDI